MKVGYGFYFAIALALMWGVYELFGWWVVLAIMLAAWAHQLYHKRKYGHWFGEDPPNKT